MAEQKKRYNLTLREDVVKAVDERHDNRSAFVERAIVHELERERARELEERHIEGYRDNPADEDEFDPLLDEQEWPS